MAVVIKFPMRGVYTGMTRAQAAKYFRAVEHLRKLVKERGDDKE